MFDQAAKKSKTAAFNAFADVTLFARSTAVKRAGRKQLTRKPGGGYITPKNPPEQLRPFKRTGNYQRSIFPRITKVRGFTGKIEATANYSHKLEILYHNLKQSAEIAVRQFPKFLKDAFREEMRKPGPGGRR